MSGIDISKLTIEAWDVDRPQPSPNNNKVHTDESVAKLAKSLADLGQMQPVLVGSDEVIIAGHGRTLAAQKLGWAKIKVIRLPVDAATAAKMRLADNLTSNNNFDMEAISEELAALMDEGSIDDFVGTFQDEKLTDLVMNDLDITAGMNLDALSDDVMSDVGDFSKEGEELMSKAEEAETPIRRAFGFDKVSPEEARKIKGFVAQVITETGIDDAKEALISWIDEVSS